MTKFIEFAHPEGGTFLVNVAHITSAHFKPGQGDIKTRLGFDLGERQNEYVLFGDEAEQTWDKLKSLMEET